MQRFYLLSGHTDCILCIMSVCFTFCFRYYLIIAVIYSICDERNAKYNIGRHITLLAFPFLHYLVTKYQLHIRAEYYVLYSP